MKGLTVTVTVIVMALLVGCVEFKAVDELEVATLESGDWSAVIATRKST